MSLAVSVGETVKDVSSFEFDGSNERVSFSDAEEVFVFLV